MNTSRIADILPLSPMQEGFLFHALYAEQNPDVYVGQQVLGIRGNLDSGRLKAAWEMLLERHPNLRARFLQPTLMKQIVQVVPGNVVLPWREVDLSHLPTDDALAELQRMADEERTRRFDLTTPPLLRFLLVQLTPDRHRLVFTYHHILFDGWSLVVMLRELTQIYAAGGDAHGLPAPTQYREYLAWLARQDRDTISGWPRSSAPAGWTASTRCWCMRTIRGRPPGRRGNALPSNHPMCGSVRSVATTCLTIPWPWE
jgi:hypothetical protein